MVTVADNGLAFTAVAERAGPFWSGRALGIQNTSQYLVRRRRAAARRTGGDHAGYAPMFALAAVFPLVAVSLVPVRDERA